MQAKGAAYLGDYRGAGMYRFIEKHSEKILNDDKTCKAVKDYTRLQQCFPCVDVSADGVQASKDFRGNYKDFWKLNAARLSEEFEKEYFQILQQMKGCSTFDPGEALRELLQTLHGVNGSEKLHFSFATKLLHTVRNELPVFDANIRAFYFLPDIPSRLGFEGRTAEASRSYMFLIREYDRVLREGLLEKSIQKFRCRYRAQQDVFSGQKVIDLLIWRFVGLIRSGWIRAGVLVYG